MGGWDPQKHKAEVEKEEETICLLWEQPHQAGDTAEGQ